jgi:hypothetical protein
MTLELVSAQVTAGDPGREPLFGHNNHHGSTAGKARPSERGAPKKKN